MSDQHHYLPISKIYPGMTLATELIDKQGQILLPAGVIITKQILASLLLHDIHQLSVLKDISDLPSLNNANLEITKQRLDIIFRHAPFEEPRNTLANLIKKFRLGETQ
jgi:hypothetical protein